MASKSRKTLKERNVPFKFIDTVKKARRAIKELKKHKVVAVDTEFPLTGARRHEVVVWSISAGAEVNYVVTGELLKTAFADWAEDSRYKKVWWNYKEDGEVVMDFCGLDLDSSFYADGMIMDWCVDETDIFHNLKHSGEKYLGWERKGYAAMFCYVPTGLKKAVVVPPTLIMEGPLPDEMLEVRSHKKWIKLFKQYAANDAAETFLLYRKLRKILKKRGYWDEYLRIDAPYTVTLRRCQARGVSIDMDALRDIHREVSIRMIRLRHLFGEQSGVDESFNIQSNDQKHELLFNQLEWPNSKTSKRFKDLVTATGAPQLNEKALTRYINDYGFEIASTLKAYGKLKTKKGTFLGGMIDGVMFGRGAKESILYSDFSQLGAKTGRISSRKYPVVIEILKHYKTRPSKIIYKKVDAGMNLQNIPNAYNDDLQIRKVFIAPPGYKMLVADYSGFELWMMLWNCHRFGIKSRMLKALLAGKDVHSMTAVAVCGLDCHWSEVKELYPDKRNSEGKRCYHPDTEVLTRKGWKRIGLLTMDDEVVQATPTGGKGVRVKLSWTKPTDLQRFKHSSKRLVHLKNEGIDLRVTPNHRMLAFDAEGAPVVCMPEELPNQKGGWVNAGQLEEENPWEVDRSLLRLAVATQADGSYQKGAIRFGFSKQRKIDRMLKLLRDVGMQYTKTQDVKRGVTKFYIAADEADPVTSLLSATKKFSWKWLRLSYSLRRTVLDEVVHWDGKIQPSGKSGQYFTTNKKNAEVLQAMATISGCKTRLTEKERTDEGWATFYKLTIHYSRASSSQAFYMKTPKKKYSKNVVCLTVPSTFLVVRDGGVPVISGNSNFNLLYGGMAKMLASIMGWDTRNDSMVKKAQRMIDVWKELWPEMPKIQKALVDHAYEYGYVTTISGRRCHLREQLEWRSHNPDRQERRTEERKRHNHAENLAKNAPNQGSAADIMKDAMNRIERDKKLKRLGYLQLFPVHDEIVGIAPIETADECLARKIHLMKQPYKDKLPFDLVVEGGIGENWIAAK